MIKGGYQILDLKNVNLIPEEDFFFSNIDYSLFAKNHRKPLLLTGIQIDGMKYPDAFISYIDGTDDDHTIIGSLYGYYWIFNNDPSVFLTKNPNERRYIHD